MQKVQFYTPLTHMIPTYKWKYSINCCYINNYSYWCSFYSSRPSHSSSHLFHQLMGPYQ